MKGLILVGGYGTRLRPLTLSVPKPLIHFCNHPIVEYQIRALVELGVRHVVLAVAYQPDTMKEALTKLESKYNIRISCSIEEEPLLTAGPIRLAEKLLRTHDEGETDSDLFFVFNSDIVAEYPLRQMLEFHRQHGHEGTMCLTKVKDPSMFGVVVSEPATGEICCFVEKPQEWINDDINAGIYLFNSSVIDRIESRPVSLEKEIFPKMAQDHQLYGYHLSGYWADIGKPRDFLDGTQLYLRALREKQDSQDDGKLQPVLMPEGPCIKGNVLVHPTAQIGDDCVIGPNVTIGQNCRIEAGCRIANSALMANVVVDKFTRVEDSIIGWNCRVGKWVRIDGLTVLGQDVHVAHEVFINGAFVLPYKAISANIAQPGQIIL